MPAYQYTRENAPPKEARVTDVTISRYEHVCEVDPVLMVENVTQQSFPNWDTPGIINSRHDHLAWMHMHWAGGVISGQELLDEITAGDHKITAPPP
jgi:hypothetical protein